MCNRIFYWLILALIFGVFTSTSAFADQIAFTQDGKKVLLKDDGTWEYVKEEQKREGLYDFRKTRWGMTKEQVKRTEQGKIIYEDEKLLVYRGNVGGLDCKIAYIFAKGKLVRAKYVSTATHTNSNDYIWDYKKWKEILTKKYGDPIEDQEIWKNDLYKDDPQNWGLAISVGHLAYFATWETPTTEITLFLHGENFEITLEVEYLSKQLEYLEEEEKEKKNLSEF